MGECQRRLKAGSGTISVIDLDTGHEEAQLIMIGSVVILKWCAHTSENAIGASPPPWVVRCVYFKMV